MAALAGCKGAPADSGLVVIVKTDLALPKDVDRLTLDVSQGGKLLLHEDQLLGAGHLLVPAEFRVPPTGNTAPALIRGVAYKDGKPAIERSAVTPIPAASVGVVQLAMNYLCVGTANADGTSTCGVERTCNQGACQTAVTTAEARVAVAARDGGADGGDAGAATATNGCFDVGACFAAATPATIEPVTCSLPLPAQADQARLNVALELPAGGAGVCGAKACWVVLDHAPDGWIVEGTRIRLAASICQPQGGAPIPTVVVTTSCGAKTAGTPSCGTWSRVMTPIESPPPPAPIGDACQGTGEQACGNCGTQTRTCRDGVWSAWGACAGEGVCAPNATQACGSGGTQSCGGSCQWGACGTQMCAGPSSQACGNCGTQTRSCDPDTGTWSAWNTCTGEGVCTPAATRTCGQMGTQTCTASCQWGAACTGQMCPAGPSSQGCGNCGTQTRTCDGNTGMWSAWGACMGEGVCTPTTTRTCGQMGTQTCTASCQWGAACTGQMCPAGASSQGCGNCGTQTRTCDGNTGTWSAWGACMAEGMCAPNTTQTCGANGQQTCGASCQWGTCSCTGASSQACGNCGTQTRTCTGGTWSGWGSCTGQGACAPNATVACGNGGTQTCGSTCQLGGCVEPNREGAPWATSGPSFSNSSAGVVDATTLLEWQRDADLTGSVTYSQAVSQCAALPAGAYGAWRVPSRSELFSLVDFTRGNPAIDPSYFPATPAVSFWSSSQQGTGNHQYIYFLTGEAYWSADTGTLRVRCVRDASANRPVSRGFSAPTTDTLQNASSGLVWQRGSSPSTVTADAAPGYCASLSLGGYSSGWRAPTIRELATIMTNYTTNFTVDSRFDATRDLWATTPFYSLNAFWRLANGNPIWSGSANPYRVRCVHD
jgi:hypothetical protein